MPHTYLPDPRPYPERTVNNKLLLLATRIARPESAEDAEEARAELKKQIAQMLGLRHYIGLSVAMTMAGAPDIYTALMDTVDEALQPENDEQLQWFALPVIVVAGADKAGELKSSCPEALINACLANYPALRPLTRAVWLPQLIRSDDFAKIKPDDWYAAKESSDAAAEFAASLPTASAAIPQDQSVHALYALGYGGRDIQAALGQSLREAALPLMQVWQEYLAEENMTLFTNPLSPASPLAALADASRTRLRMALDVFSANVIRSVRLQSPRVGVVMAAQEGGKLLFGFNAAESAYSLMSQVFSWPLSPRDDIRIIQQDFLDLMVDCQVENIRLLHDILPENAALPDYADALDLPGHNPLFGNGSDGSENGVAN